MDLTLCLKALGDPTRLTIFQQLLIRRHCTRSLSRKLGITEAAVSQHLKVLREAGLVYTERYGYHKHYLPAKEAIEFLNRLCMDMINVVVRFIPLLVFASMAHLMISTGLDALFPLGKVLLGAVAGLALVFLVCAAFAAAFGGASILPFLRQLAGFAPVPFALNSSSSLSLVAVMISLASFAAL